MIYSISVENKARFSLGEIGNNTLVVFGVNPSRATDVKFDTTITKVKNYAEKHEFDGWLMLNLYPQRTTDIAKLHTNDNAILMKKNLEEISKLIKRLPRKTLCAAWGVSICKRKYLPNCLSQIVSLTGVNYWHSIGVPTRAGHPRHPSRVSYKSPLVPFSVPDYMISIKSGT